MRIRSIVVLQFAIFFLLACAIAPSGGGLKAQPSPTVETPDNESGRKVLLISFDGFRADYLGKADTPHFDRFVAEGVRAEAMTPVFPVKTFPNHYAIATGLRPIHSGLVGNTMFDKSTGEWYRISDRGAVQNPRWYAGEPIWNTVEKAGLTAGSYFWVGSEAPVGGMQPTYWKVYDGSVTNEERIDSVIHWMTRTDGPQIDFGLLYFSDVDTYGHQYDPDSDSVQVIIGRADALVGYLMQGLELTGLLERTDVIIVSDHGMAGYSEDRIIVLDEAVDSRKVQLVEIGPILSMNLAPGTDASERDEILGRLKAHSQSDHFDVYLHEELPSEYQFGESPRATDVYLVPEAGYVILPERSVDFFKASLPAGGHGYWPTDPVMKAIFFANGPSIAQGRVIPEFPNVNVYGLVCRLLGIQPAPYDGDPEWPIQVLR